MQTQLQKPVHKLIQEVETRWNSTYLMLQRLYEQREPVGAAAAHLTTDIPPLTFAEYETVSECLDVLAPFHLAPSEMSAEKHVSASKVIPLMRMVQHKLAVKASALYLIKQLQHELVKRCTVENVSFIIPYYYCVFHTSLKMLSALSVSCQGRTWAFSRRQLVGSFGQQRWILLYASFCDYER